MNVRLLALGVMLAVSTCALGYEKKLVHVLEQLRECTFDGETPLVGGPAIGYAGTPHEFYLLFPYFDQVATDDDLIAMLRDQSPVVRIMAVKCIVRKKEQTEAMKQAIAPLRNDRSKVFVMTFGCSAMLQTVSEVFAELRRDPDFLRDLKEGLNQRSPPSPPTEDR